MSPSTSVGPNGLLIDTNVLSLLAVANKLTLLQETATMPLYITPRIVEELHIGLSKGVLALGNVLALINNRPDPSAPAHIHRKSSASPSST